MVRIAYYVHNLADAAVERRVRMLRAGGAEVSLAGFCRDGAVPRSVAGAPAMLLGRTRDADLRQRAAAVLRNCLRPAAVLSAAAGADVIVARNLEMLGLAQLARRQLAVPRLVYESLDIHRTLLAEGAAARALRLLERRWMQRADLLIYSSPAFLAEYFAPVQQLSIPALLVENKLLQLGGAELARPPWPAAGQPWTIGWFGNLRCRRTLATLLQIAERAKGRVRILIAGKASPAEFADFAAQVVHPHVRFTGPYTAADLPALYGQCHFAWAIDYFEEGLNSTWLLPNRLYEAAAHGAVPIALESVQTGRWLAQAGAGLLLSPGAEGDALLARLTELDTAGYDRLRCAVAAIPTERLLAREPDCRELVQAIAG